ncbi:MAG: nitrate/nitrite transporter NrtS [Novosphingobium sp.]|nr:nitrate/nitrite transporter NrtS [Novosphingobium sp.]
MTTAREALRQTFSGRILRRSLIVALVVGTILNAINQGPEIFGGEDVAVWKLLLTFCVPFLVASFGAFSALAAASVRDD